MTVENSMYSACFMVHTNINDRNRELITLPDNFDLDRHIIQYPPELHGFRSKLMFNKEKAYHFLGLISSIISRSPDVVLKDGFTPIFQKKVRDSIKDIKQYIDYLINTGVIVSNGTYIVGKQSLGYKWSQQYSLRRFSVKDILCRYKDYDNQQYKYQFTQYPYLFHWYQQNKLMIDDTAAEEYAWLVYQDKMNDLSKESWDINTVTGEKKHPESQYKSALLSIAKIKYQHYEAHIDNNVHRLHSAFTGIGKKYRKFVSYDGQKLVGIDVTNSQPYIVSLILNKEFWNIFSFNSSLPFNFKSLYPMMQTRLMSIETIKMIEDYFNNVEENAFLDYKKLVSSGRFYENIIEIVKEHGRTIDRDDAKILIFYTIYSSNKLPQDPFLRQMRDIFKNMFPQVEELFKIIKHEFKSIKEDEEYSSIFGRQHNRLACLLQHIESEILLHKCCKRIWEEGNQQIPVFTIHDNIVTTVGNEDFVANIMTEELTKYIRLAPTLSLPEYWE